MKTNIEKLFTYVGLDEVSIYFVRSTTSDIIGLWYWSNFGTILNVKWSMVEKAVTYLSTIKATFH